MTTTHAGREPIRRAVRNSAAIGILPARAFLAIALTFALGCSPQDRPGIDAAPAVDRELASNANSAVVPFSDRAQELGIQFTFRNGSDAKLSPILESLGGGLGWCDFDRDGWLDLAVVAGGHFPSEKSVAGRASGLFRNLDGKQFVSVGDVAGIENSQLYTNGITIGDYDNDGFQDLLISGYGRPQLWHNLGDGTFKEESAAAGILDDRWGSSAAWADLNGDGDLDLYLEHYVNWSFDNHPYCGGSTPETRDNCPPRDFQPLPDRVYFSQGDGSFADATAFAGLREDGKGLGVLLCDVEPDGDTDIYVANDTTDNFLYINDGQGRFEEIAVAAGAARDDSGIPNGSMGVDLCDFNGDGLPDIWVANYERESFALYRNEGRDRFLHVSQRLGITDLGGLFVGFGTACADFDSDGDDDMAIANGHVLKFPTNAPRKQLPLLMQYDGRRYQRAPSAPGTYFGDPHEGRGLAIADFDADGDVDIAISHLNEPVALLENNFHKHNRTLALSLIGIGSNRDAVGARVELRELRSGKRVWSRQITGGGSYLSHSSRTILFALDEAAESRTLVVHWPSGRTQRLDAASLAGEVTLLEPAAEDDTSPRLFLQREFR